MDFDANYWREILDNYVDFDSELAPGDYRRDYIPTSRDDVARTRTRETDGLPDGLDGISKDGRFGGMEIEIPTKSDYYQQETETSSIPSPCDTTTELFTVRQSGRYRRCTTGTVRVCQLWPDPATGCVYGGACALFDGEAYEHSACTHPPVLESRALLDYNKTHASRLSPNDRGRRSIPFASRLRWIKQTNRRRCHKRVKKNRTRKETKKTQTHTRCPTRRTSS